MNIFFDNLKNYFKSTLLYLIFFIFIIFLLEAISRTVIYIFSNDVNIYKVGLNKKYALDIEDLTQRKFNIINLSKTEISTDTKNFNNKKIKNENKTFKEKIFYVFGGSSTYGNNCGPVGSWVDDLQKKIPSSKFYNFAINGGDSDYSLHKLLKELNSNKEKPDFIIWANKFNERNVIFKGSSYRNFKKLNYNFLNANTSKVVLFSHSLSLTLRNYLVSYNIIENLSKKLRKRVKNVGIIDVEMQKQAQKLDFFMASKNYQINTIDAIDFSRNFSEKFIILHLLDSYVLNKNQNKKELKYSFSQTFKFDNLLVSELSNRAEEIEKSYPSYVNYINLDENNEDLNYSELFCEDGSFAHKTKKGNTLTSELVYNHLLKLAN